MEPIVLSHSRMRSNLPESANTIRWGLRLAGLAFAAVQAFATRNAMDPDGRSYMEVARAYLRHDWAMAVNSYWGPLYSWIMMPFLGLTKPSLRHEYPLIHLINFGLFVLCALAFESFWTQLLAYRKLRDTGVNVESRSLPDFALWILGYALFIRLLVGLVSPVTPDLALAVVVLALASVLLRIMSSNRLPAGLFVSFGALLGIGYLTKAVMFPLAMVFLAELFLVVPSRKFIRCALAFALFLGIAAPEVIWLSASKGHLTFSGVGKLNYAWFNYGVPYLHWQGQPPGSGIPAHPTRRIHSHPDLFEFNGPIRSSYPPWYDPTYWNEGIAVPFQPKIVARHLVRNVWELGKIVCEPRMAILGFLALLLFADLKKTWNGLAGHWPLLAATAAVMAAYCLTLVTFRYYAPWGMLLWGSVLCAVRLRPVFAASPRFRLVATAMAIAVGGLMILQAGHGVYGQWRNPYPDDATRDYVTAEGLQKMGVQAGDKVGSIGFGNEVFFVYLARLSIVAEIKRKDTCEFWQASPAVQLEVMEKFKQSGVKVIVANTGSGVRSRGEGAGLDIVSCARPGPGWRQIEGSLNRAYFLR